MFSDEDDAVPDSLLELESLRRQLVVEISVVMIKIVFKIFIYFLLLFFDVD